jgi:hypothetical protein
MPQVGRYSSHVLGLELGIEGTKLRFYHGRAALPDAQEVIDRLDSALTEAHERAHEEAQRADLAEQKLAEALAELEGLKRSR